MSGREGITFMRKPRESVRKQKNGKWLARLQYYDHEGKRRNVNRTADTKNEAEDSLAKLKQKHLSSVSGDKTFSDIALDLKQKKYTDPEYSETGELTRGVRNPRKAHSIIDCLERAFGNKTLSEIRLADLERYRDERRKKVTVATVNRELSLMRAAFKWAMRREYVSKSPFDLAEPGKLIAVSAESKRKVVVTPEQEEALLAQCNTERRRHLRALIITLLDSGCRLGEILNLRWSDIDFAKSEFTAVSYKGKNRSERKVPLTSRVRATFLELREKPSLHSFRKKDADQHLVFGIVSNVQKSFHAARKAAGLSHVRLHDLRHTSATRLAESGMNLSHVGAILGHSNLQTTMRYVNSTDAVVQAAREILERKAR